MQLCTLHCTATVVTQHDSAWCNIDKHNYVNGKLCFLIQLHVVHNIVNQEHNVYPLITWLSSSMLYWKTEQHLLLIQHKNIIVLRACFHVKRLNKSKVYRFLYFIFVTYFWLIIQISLSAFSLVYFAVSIIQYHSLLRIACVIIFSCSCGPTCSWAWLVSFYWWNCAFFIRRFSDEWRDTVTTWWWTRHYKKGVLLTSLASYLMLTHCLCVSLVSSCFMLISWVREKMCVPYAGRKCPQLEGFHVVISSTCKYKKQKGDNKYTIQIGEGNRRNKEIEGTRKEEETSERDDLRKGVVQKHKGRTCYYRGKFCVVIIMPRCACAEGIW